MKKMNKTINNNIYGETMAMSEAPSNYWKNKEYLLSVIMNKLEITNEDLNNEHGWIVSKVRENNLDSLLQEN
jgi:hypothetical protein